MSDRVPAILGIGPGSQWCAVVAILNGELIDSTVVSRRLAVGRKEGPAADLAFDQACVERINEMMDKHRDEALKAWERVGVNATVATYPWRIGISTVWVDEGYVSQEHAATRGLVRVIAQALDDPYLADHEAVKDEIAKHGWMQDDHQWHRLGFMGHDATRRPLRQRSNRRKPDRHKPDWRPAHKAYAAGMLAARRRDRREAAA